MILYLEGLPSGYEIEMLSRMFFPVLTLAGDRTPFPPPPQEDWLLVRAAPDGLSVGPFARAVRRFRSGRPLFPGKNRSLHWPGCFSAAR